MNKASSLNGLRISFPAFLLLTVGGLYALAQDRFSITVGARDMLVIQGDHRTELPLPSISQTVIMNGTTFQLSYGRDANGLLTAIVAPNPSEPQDVHFDVLGKNIDSDRQAVVTLNFSKDEKQVRIDPGYVGVVEVNSQKMRPDSAANFHPHSATDATPAEQAALSDNGPADTVAALVAPATPIPASESVPAPVPPVAANTPSTVTSPSEAANDRVSVHNPDPMQVNNANQMPLTGSATPGPSTVASQGDPAAPKQHPLFWAEPITPPSGAPPSVASDEMKLIEVQGSVSVKTPGGNSRDGQNGMIVPSGSIVSTSTGASAAVFMGGVNSIRLLPNTDVQVTQIVNGSLRKTIIDLRDGTVFSRVGHHPGETQNYMVETPEGTSVAKGTEFADSVAGGHHYVFVVKGIVNMLTNDVLTGTLTALPGNLAAGAMPPATDGNKVLFAALTALQPFQSKTQAIVSHINAGTATPPELAYYDKLKSTFTVMVDDVYDPTHPNAFLGAFTSNTGFGDSNHSSLERPQDFADPNPNNLFNGLIPPSFEAGAAPQQAFVTPAVDPGAVSAPVPQAPLPPTT